MKERTLKDRIGKTFLHCKGCDIILIVNTSSMDPNFLYITGFTSGVFEYSHLLLEKGGAVLFTSELEYDTAKAQLVKDMKLVLIKNGEELKKTLGERLEGKVVGLNGSFLPYGTYERIRRDYKTRDVFDVSEAFSKARMIKDEGEVSFIRKAAGITKWAMLMIEKEFREGMTELELASRFDSISASLGSQEPSFKTIVCFGRNAAYPHHSPDDTKLKYGDFILIDAGAKADNYSSDITRTFIFGDDKERIRDYNKKIGIYNIVKKAQLRAIKGIRTGLRGREVHKIARDYIDNAEGGRYRGRFIHSLGHSLGIEVHDGQGFSPNSEEELRPGMVITVEPGIYIEGFGGVRIEDDVLITDDGAIVL